MKHKFYISLGSNEGDRFYNIITSVLKLRRFFNIVGFSSVYLTQPWRMEGRNFLNICLLLSTEYDPFEVLRICQNVERELGRRHKGRPYRSRTIDIDILLWQGITVKSSELVIPHPLMKERDFVNIPLKELFSLGYTNMGYEIRINGDMEVKKVVDKEALRID